MGYRTVSFVRARRMAKAAGLTRKQVIECSFREGMAEHAAKLLISITVKRRALNDKTRETAIGVGAAETKAYSDTAGQA